MVTPLVQKILFVEDDHDILFVAKIALETVGGFDVWGCSSGVDALAAVRAGYRPDLMLLDVMMPEMNGPTVCTELRKVEGCESVAVIFMTAKVQPVEVSHYCSLGALGVIPKPFDPMQLASQVRQLWDQHYERT